MKRFAALTLAFLAGCAAHVERNPDLSAKYDEFGRAKLLYLQEDYQGALKALEGLAAKNINKLDKFWVLLDIADIYYDALNEPEKALDALQKAQALLPDGNPLLDEVYYRKGLVLEALGRTVDAAKAYEAVATKFDKSPWTQDALDGVDRVFERNFREYVAKVDGVYITRLQLDNAIDRVPPMQRPRFQTPEGKREMVERLIDEVIVQLEAENLGLDTLPEVVEEVRRARTNALRRVYYEEEIRKPITVSDKEARKRYEKEKERYRVAGRVRGKRVVVKDSALAAAILDSVKAGTPIDSLAKRHSIYKAEARRGGSFTIVETNKRLKELYEKLMASEDTLLLLPESDTTWGVFLVTERQKPRIREYKEVAASIKNLIKTEREREAWDKRRKELRERFKFEVYIDTTTEELPETLAYSPVLKVAITKERLQKELERIPPMFRRRYETPQGRYNLLTNLINDIVVVKDAELKKYFLKSTVVSEVQQARKRARQKAFWDTQIAAKVSVSDDEIEKYYKEHKDEFKVPAMARFKRIVVKSKRQARNILRMLRRGEFTFDSLAKKFGVLKGDAGRVITVFENNKPENFVKAVLKKKKGWLGIVPYDTMWAVVKIVEVRKAGYKSLDEVKEQIKRTIRFEKEKARAEELKERLKKKYGVEIYLKAEEEGKEEKGEKEGEKK